MADSDSQRLENKVDTATNLISELKGMLAAALPHIQQRQDDHENRIRGLEKSRDEMAASLKERARGVTRRDAILTLVFLALGVLIPVLTILYTHHH